MKSLCNTTTASPENMGRRANKGRKMKRPTHQDLELLALGARLNAKVQPISIAWSGGTQYTLHLGPDGVPEIQEQAWWPLELVGKAKAHRLTALELETYQRFLIWEAA